MRHDLHIPFFCRTFNVFKSYHTCCSIVKKQKAAGALKEPDNLQPLVSKQCFAMIYHQALYGWSINGVLPSPKGKRVALPSRWQTALHFGRSSLCGNGGQVCWTSSVKKQRMLQHKISPWPTFQMPKFGPVLLHILQMTQMAG